MIQQNLINKQTNKKTVEKQQIVNVKNARQSQQKNRKALELHTITHRQINTTETQTENQQKKMKLYLYFDEQMVASVCVLSRSAKRQDENESKDAFFPREYARAHA